MTFKIEKVDGQNLEIDARGGTFILPDNWNPPSKSFKKQGKNLVHKCLDGTKITFLGFFEKESHLVNSNGVEILIGL